MLILLVYKVIFKLCGNFVQDLQLNGHYPQTAPSPENSAVEIRYMYVYMYVGIIIYVWLSVYCQNNRDYNRNVDGTFKKHMYWESGNSTNSKNLVKNSTNSKNLVKSSVHLMYNTRCQ